MTTNLKAQYNDDLPISKENVTVWGVSSASAALVLQPPLPPPLQ